MKILPSLSDTKVNTDTQVWIPNSFNGFLQELNHIIDWCKNNRSLALFRGHSNSKWLLDSMFVRSFKNALFDIPLEDRLSQRITESAEFYHSILNLFFLKFGVLMHPSDELKQAAQHDDLDVWFEFMKRLQQYQKKEDTFFLKGTNLLDWTKCPDVALYFANEKRNSDGAVFICDATATGRTLQRCHLGAILEKMRELGKTGQSLGAPLLFYPSKQIKCQRTRNQNAVYFAQMDLRFDLEYIWQSRRNALPSGETIAIKLVLPAGSEAAASEYLERKKITRAFIYPDA